MCVRLMIVPVLYAVRERSKPGRGKRVENRQDEHARGEHVERLHLRAHDELTRERLIRG